MRAATDMALWVWQLPQNLLGLAFGLFVRPCLDVPCGDSRAVVRRSDRMRGGISLGRYVYVESATQETVKHELGHCAQSRMLGPLYLLVIGLPSLVWAALYGRVISATPGGYYEFWTERWADRLGGVRR